MNEREKTIRLWFDMWLNRSILLNSIYSKGYCDHSSCSTDRNSHQKRNQQCRKPLIKVTG